MRFFDSERGLPEPKGNIVNNLNNGDERKTCEFMAFVGCHICTGCRYEWKPRETS